LLDTAQNVVDMNRSYKFELDPNNRVKSLLAQHAGTARFAWNWSLARRIERFKTQEGKEKFTNAMAEHKALNILKSTEFPWMYEVSKCAPHEALRNLDKAFKSFWARRKEGVGFPRFKKRDASRDSFSLNGSIKVQDRYVQLPKIGTGRLKERTGGRVKGRILSATVSRTADRWFVSIATVEDRSEPKPIQGPVVGVDLGLSTFATLSDGIQFISPGPLKSTLARLKRAQQSHSRKQKGSNNRRKAALKVAKIHARVANIRKDFLHKITTQLAKTKSVIVIEDLNVRGMIKNHCLARSIFDQGWGEFRRQLGYKTAWYGSRLVTADRWFPSSKMCSNCGHKLPKLNLSIRKWNCPGCSCVHDRDHNAAINLERLAYREFPEIVTPKGVKKPVEIPLAEALGAKAFKVSQGSLKQEANIGSTQ
jgi:putative transposase